MKKTAIIAGGTGEVGEGMVLALLKQGYRVAVPVRSEEKGERLRQYVGDYAADLVVASGSLNRQEEANDAVARLVKVLGGTVSLAVASLGGWYQGPKLHETPQADWDRVLQNNLTSHFHFAQAVVRVLERQGEGTLVMLNGAAQDMVMPGAGLMTLISAGQTVLSKVLAAEARGQGYRVFSLLANTPVVTRGRGEQVRPDWVTAEQLGDYAARLAEAKGSGEQVVHRVPKVEN